MGSQQNFQSCIAVIQHKDVRTHYIPNVDEIEVNWDDNICKPMHKSVIRKLTIDTKYHMKLHTIFGVVTLDTLSNVCHVKST